MINIVKKDILDSTEDIIVQQVNCQGVMGSGLAMQLRMAYPEMYFSYKNYCDYNKPEELLGTVHLYFHEERGQLVKTVASIFGQLDYGRVMGKVYTDYYALHTGLSDVSKHARRMKKTTAIPYGLGAGLGGGDWGKIAKIVERYFIHDYTTYYKLEK